MRERTTRDFVGAILGNVVAIAVLLLKAKQYRLHARIIIIGEARREIDPVQAVLVEPAGDRFPFAK